MSQLIKQRGWNLLFLKNHRPYDFVYTHCTPTFHFKVMQRNFMNRMGVFGTLIFVAVAISILN